MRLLLRTTLRRGDNPVSRCYVSASGSVSFETMRRPQIGRPLPDESASSSSSGNAAVCRSADGPSALASDAGEAARAPAQTLFYPVLCPLGMVPEARWAQVFGPRRPLPRPTRLCYTFAVTHFTQSATTRT